MLCCSAVLRRTMSAQLCGCLSTPGEMAIWIIEFFITVRFSHHILQVFGKIGLTHKCPILRAHCDFCWQWSFLLYITRSTHVVKIVATYIC